MLIIPAEEEPMSRLRDAAPVIGIVVGLGVLAWGIFGSIAGNQVEPDTILAVGGLAFAVLSGFHVQTLGRINDLKGSLNTRIDDLHKRLDDHIEAGHPG